MAFLDAFFTMIPKTDGDSAPLGQRPLCVFPIVFGYGPQSGLGIFNTGSIPGFQTLFLVMVRECPVLMLGAPPPWTLRKFLVGLWSADVVKSLFFFYARTHIEQSHSHVLNHNTRVTPKTERQPPHR